MCRIWPRAAILATKLWGLTSTPFDDYNGATLTQKALILASYVHFKFHLKYFGIDAADILFHRTAEDRISSGSKYWSRSEISIKSNLKTENDMISYIWRSVSNATDARNNLNEIVGQITSQCEGIPEEIQIPFKVSVIKIAQINIANGATGSRRNLLTKWLSEKAKDGFILIGLCEVNGWQDVSDKINFKKNFPEVQRTAAQAGFVHSFVTSFSDHPFNIGLVSSLPFEVLGVYGKPIFERG